MIQYIIREVEPEAADFSFYFDDDGFKGTGEDYFNNLFIISADRFGRISGFNSEEYNDIRARVSDILEGFYDVEHMESSWTGYSSYKDVMEDFGIEYNSRRCHALKEWAKDADEDKPESIAAFLTITTGKKWAVTSARGYCQGDYVDIVFCPERYPDGVKKFGEVFLGAAKEFCVIDLDENGEETNCCYGYIVADCEAWKDEEYKRLVCEWAGISEDETRLEMIESCTYSRNYSYRIA